MSRKKEQLAWDTFKRHADKVYSIRLWRVENAHCDGMCDVYVINNLGESFWLEMKALDEWPKRASTLPLRSVFEPGQIPFMKEIRSMGGVSFVLLRVGADEWYLLNPRAMDYELVDLTMDQIINYADATGLESIMTLLSGEA